jgi:hypothetical protein
VGSPRARSWRRRSASNRRRAPPESHSRQFKRGAGEQQRLLREVEAFARKRDLGHVVDDWQPDVGFLRGD